MKTRISFVLLMALALMFGCNQTPNPSSNQAPPEEPDKDAPTLGLRPDTVNESHYILSFVKPKSFTARVWDNGGGIWLYFDAQHHNGYQDTDNESYLALCDRYGDVTYKQQRIFAAAEDQGFSYLADNIVSIAVVTETNFDAEHPAGSSLNDISTLAAESPYKHIKSGYTLTHDWPVVNNWQQDKGSIPFSKQLTECTAEDLILMGDGYSSLCQIRLNKLPKEGSTQLLTITLTDQTGRVYTATTGPFSW